MGSMWKKGKIIQESLSLDVSPVYNKIIPWNLYLFYGDRSILEDQFTSMKSWVDYITKVDGDNHGWRYVFHYGDWLALDNPVQGAEQVMGATDEEFIANLYYAISAGIVAKAAGVLGYRGTDETAASEAV